MSRTNMVQFANFCQFFKRLCTYVAVFVVIGISVSTVKMGAAEEVGNVGPHVLEQKLQALKVWVNDGQNAWSENSKKFNKVSRRMVASTCALVAVGSIPFIFANPLSPQSRFIGPLAGLIARPLVKYGLCALGCLGSALAVRLLYLYHSRNTFDKYLGRFQTFVEPMVKEVAEIETQVKEVQDRLGSEKLRVRTLTEGQLKQQEEFDLVNKSLKREQQIVHTLRNEMGGVQLKNQTLEQEISNLKSPMSGRDPFSPTIKILPEKEVKEEAESVSLQPARMGTLKDLLAKLQEGNESFAKELAGLAKHEDDQFSEIGTDSAGTRPISPRTAMCQMMNNRLKSNIDALKAIQAKIDELSQKPTD